MFRWSVLVGVIGGLTGCTGSKVKADCTAAGHCRLQDGAPTCEEGFDWENPGDRRNLKCVLVAMPLDDEAPLLVRFAATPATVIDGQSTDIAWSWAFSNRPSPSPECVVDQGVGVTINGATTRVTLTAPTTYTLTCTNRAGSDTAQTTVRLVVVPEVPVVSIAPKIASFAATPASVVGSALTDLTWSWSFVQSPSPEPRCVIDQGIGAMASGTSSQVNLSDATVYTLTCTNSAGSDAVQTTVSVSVPVAPVAPKIASFSARPDSVPTGVPTNVTWSWSFANSPTPAPSCFIDHGLGAWRSGTKSAVTLDDTTSYTLTCANSAGSDSATTTLVATPVPEFKIVGFGTSPSVVGRGEPTSIMWRWALSGSPVGEVTCTLDQGLGKVHNGLVTTLTLYQPTTYTLRCRTPTQSSSASTTLTPLIFSPPLTYLSGTVNQQALSAGSHHTCAIKNDQTLACWGNSWFGQSTAPAGPFLAVSVGYTNTCAIKADSTLSCWGANGFHPPIQTTTPPEGRFIAVGTALMHACAIKSDQTLVCWGDTGVPGGGPDRGRLTPPDGRFIALSVGGYSACAIRSDHTLACWGDPEPSDADKRRLTPPEGEFVAVSVGWGYACAIRGDHTLACWSWISDHQAPPDGRFVAVSANGTNACAIRDDHTLACWGDSGYGPLTPPDGTFTAVSVGAGYACAVRSDNTVTCWRRSTDFVSYGQADPPTSGFVDLVVSRDVACAIKSDNTLVCWGAPPMPPAGSFVAMSLDDSHGCAIRSDQTLACWGDNYFGEATPPTGTFIAVTSGNRFSCGIKTDNTLVCWGDRMRGKSNPPMGAFVAVSTRREYSCAVKVDNTVVCWGNNDSGYGRTLPPAGSFVAASSGGFDACAITSNAALTCWGTQFFSELLPPTGNFVAVAVGWYGGCAIKSDHTLARWGPSPNNLEMGSPPGTFVAVSAESYSFCGLRSDGLPVCWGQYVR